MRATKIHLSAPWLFKAPQIQDNTQPSRGWGITRLLFLLQEIRTAHAVYPPASPSPQPCEVGQVGVRYEARFHPGNSSCWAAFATGLRQLRAPLGLPRPVPVLLGSADPSRPPFPGLPTHRRTGPSWWTPCCFPTTARAALCPGTSSFRGCVGDPCDWPANAFALQRRAAESAGGATANSALPGWRAAMASTRSA